MQTVNISIASITESVRNPNRMDPDLYERLVQAIKQLGFWQPILVRTKPGDLYEVADGHHRLRAARDLGYMEVPAVVIDGLSDSQIELLKLGMNRLRGDPDLAIVAEVLRDLEAAGVEPAEMELTGFSVPEITDLLESLKRGEREDIPPNEAGSNDEDDTEDPTKPFVLEIEFKEKEAYQFARRKLKRAAGKGGDLATGLMRVLGEEE